MISLRKADNRSQEIKSLEYIMEETLPPAFPSIQTAPRNENLDSTSHSSAHELEYQASKRKERLVKNRFRMRKYRAVKHEERLLLNANVLTLTNQLHQILKMHENRNIQCSHYMGNISLHHESRKDYLMRSYVQLIAISERIRNENLLYTQTFTKTWEKYTKVIQQEFQSLYNSIQSPRDYERPFVCDKHIVVCQPTHPDQISSKRYTLTNNGQWISFYYRRPIYRNTNDVDNFLYREFSEDVYFRPISESICNKLQAEAYAEGMGLTNVVQHEIELGSRRITTGVDYFDWKVTYYPISTLEVYPHFMTAVNLKTSPSKVVTEDLIRFDFVKQYKLESHQDFKSIFSQIRDRCWKVITRSISQGKLHLSENLPAGFVLQTINDQTSIVIRSFTTKSMRTIHQCLSIVSRCENEYFISFLNPYYYLQHMEGQKEMKPVAGESSKFGEDRVFWESRGHLRYAWRIVNGREYEIRYGGTLMLGNYNINSKIRCLGEILVDWEHDVIH